MQESNSEHASLSSSPTIDAPNDATTEAMNRCLQAPEILRLICDELPVVRREQRQTALALALSCRALLEPALDRLWYNVNTFEIFRCMLPSDVWKLETIRIKHKDRKDKDNYVYKLLDLRRAITAEDLDRYLNYYAPRIRKIHPRHMNFTLSPAAWHGLHLAVNWQSGALAPRAVEINWHLTPPKENLIPPDVLNQAWPYYILFTGFNTTSLDFVFRSDSPIQVGSLRNAAQHPNLMSLHIEDKTITYLEDEDPTFIDKYIQSFQWSCLQDLDLIGLTGESLDHLSTLPSLKSLKVRSLGYVELLHEYQPVEHNFQSAYISELSSEAFVSLETLDLSSEDIASISGVLQRIPPKNQISVLKLKLNAAMERQRELRELLATIQYHCNRERLRHLEMLDNVCQYGWEEYIEIDIEPVVDITPFFEFGNLETVIFSLSENVALTQANINQMTSSWPHLVELTVDVGFPTSRAPLVDHTDFLTLVYGCPRLKRLGLYFDTTRVTGTDLVPLSVNPSQNLKPASLVHLNVGASPIYSPSKAAEFLRAHCPSLFQGRGRLAFTSIGRVRPNVFNSLYSARWERVVIAVGRGL